MTDTTDKITLEPCPNPWCIGSNPKVANRGDCYASGYLVACSKCGIEGPYIAAVEKTSKRVKEDGEAKAEAETAWNTRLPISSPVAGELVELVEALDCHTDADGEVWLTINEKDVSGQGAVRIGSEKRIVSQCFAKWKEKRDAILTALQAQPAVDDETVRGALTKAAETFRFYQKSHSEKAFAADDQKEAQSRNAKAERNREMAEMCEAALATHQDPRAAALDEAVRNAFYAGLGAMSHHTGKIFTEQLDDMWTRNQAFGALSKETEG